MPLFIASDKQQDWLKYAHSVLPILTNPDLPILLIDNVADYYYTGTGQEFWDLRKDFPNLAPPFPMFWAEHRLAGRIHSDKEGDTDMSGLLGREARMGVVATVVTRDHVEGKNIPEGAHWIYWMDIFIRYDHVKGDRAFGPHGAIMMAVDKEGRIVDTPWMQTFCWDQDKEMMKSLMVWTYPALLAICFLHCKNVTIQEETVPKALAKKHHAKTGQWPTKYRTLVIEPLKQILRTQGRSHEVGVAKAMHICRGHFRDYREGRGLFGKIHALVWTPMTVRGTKGKAEEMPPREIEVKI